MEVEPYTYALFQAIYFFKIYLKGVSLLQGHDR